MRVIPPVTVTAALLTSSTLIETTPSAYNAGTTYAAGDLVYVGTVGLALTVYESLQAGNTGHTPASSPSWWEDVGEVYAEYAGGTTYAAGDIVQVAATHLVYESLVGSNLGNAVTDATKWLEIGPTNKWKMFDLLRNTQSTQPGAMTVVLTPGERINSLALFGLVANAVTITVTSVFGGGTVYTRTVDLNEREVFDWYDYFFADFSTQPTVVDFELPPYSDAVITVTITATSGNVSCGGLVIGNYVYLGTTKAAAESDVLNFSSVTRDDFGNSEMVQRRNVPKTNQDVVCDKSRVNSIRAVREALNAVPAVWSGLDDDSHGYFESLFILGYYRRFSINLAYAENAVISLELEEV